MKICIYGAGAIGGYMAVMMKRAGVDVSLIARGPHLAAIRENGLKLLIDGQELVAEMPATKVAAELGPQDFVVVGLKSHQAWESAEDMAPLFGPDTAVVTAQNGVPWWYFYGLEGPFKDLRLKTVDPGDRQWNAIGPERVIGATVYPATEIIEPGVIQHTYGDAFGLGEPNRQKTDRLKAFGDALEAGGLKARYYDDIRDDIWLKLWGNLCFNPISALTRATLDVIATDPGTRALARNMMLEAQAIGEKLGAHLQGRRRAPHQRRGQGRRAPHLDAAGRRGRQGAGARRAAVFGPGDGRARQRADALYRHGAGARAADGPLAQRLSRPFPEEALRPAIAAE